MIVVSNTSPLTNLAAIRQFNLQSHKEVHKMIQLTPLEETVAGKELIQIGVRRGQKKGQETGIKKGEVIGEIRATQRMLNMSVSPIKELEKKGITTLRKILLTGISQSLKRVMSQHKKLMENMFLLKILSKLDFIHI